MNEQAARVVARGPPNAPFRQWVLTLPGELARVVAFDADLATALFGVFADELARTHPSPSGLLLSEVIMPVMNGRELAQVVRGFWPDVRCLFMSGYTADTIANRGVVNKDVRFLQKPFLEDALSAAVRAALAAAAEA